MNKKTNSLYKIYVSILGVLLISVFIQVVIYDRCKIKYIFAILGVFLMLLGMLYVVKSRNWMNVFFIVMLVIRILIILKIATPPVSDFEILFNSAENLLQGNNVMNSLNYFFYFPYQTAVVLYFTFLLKIYNSVVTIKIANCFFSVGTLIIVYFIAKEFVNEKIAKMATICYALFPFSLFYNTILSNQIPGAFFFYSGIYFIVLNRKKNNIKFVILAGILMGIGNIIRPEGIIFIVSILGFELFIINKKNIKKVIREIVVILVTYFIIIQIASFAVRATEMNYYGLKNNNTNMKFVYGLNLDSKGMWNKEDARYLGNEQKQRKIINERIKKLNIKNSIPFLNYKIKEILGPGTLWWTFDYLNDDEVVLGKEKNWWFSEGEEYNKTYFYIVFVFMILGIISFKDKEIESNVLFLNIIAVNMVVYMLIEIQSRYAYISQVAIFITAAIGGDWFYTKIMQWRSMWKNKFMKY